MDPLISIEGLMLAMGAVWIAACVIMAWDLVCPRSMKKGARLRERLERRAIGDHRGGLAWWWGYAYYDWERCQEVYYPYGLHWIVGVVMHAQHQLARRRKRTSWIDLQVQALAEDMLAAKRRLEAQIDEARADIARLTLQQAMYEEEIRKLDAWLRAAVSGRHGGCLCLTREDIHAGAIGGPITIAGQDGTGNVVLTSVKEETGV